MAAMNMEVSEALGIQSKKRFRPEYISRVLLCPAAKRQKYSLEFRNGDIMDHAYRNLNTLIAHVVDCVSVRPYGVSKILAARYPFSSPYITRRRVGAFNWARPKDRGYPGTIEVFKTKKHNPFVVNMYAQFYAGKSIDENASTQNLVSQLRRVSKNDRAKGFRGDDHLIEGLEDDTLENRQRWLKKCLGKLAQFVRFAEVRTVVFPYKVASGLSPGDWEKHYLFAIESFLHELSNCKVKVIVLNIDQRSMR